MEMIMKFINMKHAVHAQFSLILSQPHVFVVGLPGTELESAYLPAFPEGTDPMFRTRTEHDCTCCKNYIRNAGNVVAFIDGKMATIWDIEIGGFYQVVADALAARVRSAQVAHEFVHEFSTIGVDRNKDPAADITWDHFYMKLPAKFVKSNTGAIRGKSSQAYASFYRSLTDLTPESYSAVLELIEDKNLYKGDEYKRRVTQFANYQKEYLATEDKQAFLWTTSAELGMTANLRGDVIGTLLQDISKGKDLEIAVRAFEKMTAPDNFKRSKKIATESQKKRAFATIQALGIDPSLPRRHATILDITINNVLFADRVAKESMGVLDILNLAPPVAKVDPNVIDISSDDFLATVLPKIDSMKVLVNNSHVGNFMSLVAPVNADAPGILAWDNNFSWTYNGEVTDSMAQRVEESGGRIDGVFRFTHEWNHNGDNQSLMDLHVFFPNSGYKEHTGSEEIHDRYPNNNRVGWNNRKHGPTGGVQDVDFVHAPGLKVPIENITFPHLNKMPEGTYPCKIHNWNSRKNPKSGFKAEIAFGDEIYQYTYEKPLKHKEWITVANVTLKGGKFTIEHKLPHAATTREIWGIHTQSFHKVDTVMLSPNFWDNNASGNKHLFFILEGCVNPDSARGLYNEFLSPALYNDRKVFEMLGDKLKVPHSSDQLSGLGFSSTIRNSVVAQVRGEINRTYNIKF